jgi:hypothetical protein
VVDKTALCSKPDGVALGEENASSRCTVKVRPSRNALRMNRIRCRRLFQYLVGSCQNVCGD